MRFEADQSPAMTPSWRSAAWNRAPAIAAPDVGGDASPVLGAEDEAEWEAAGEQVRAFSLGCHGPHQVCWGAMLERCLGWGVGL